MIDLWLMHWPGPGRHLDYPPVKMGMDRPKVEIDTNKEKMVPMDWSPDTRLDTYNEMAKFVGKEVVALGVCNYSARQLTQLLDFCLTNNLPRPAVVQNEFRSLLLAREVRVLCKKDGVMFQAYANPGAGSLELMDNKVVKNIASKVGVNEAQVLLRWGVEHGCALLPKSAKDEEQQGHLGVQAEQGGHERAGQEQGGEEHHGWVAE